jgi:Rieske Fe-S protein
VSTEGINRRQAITGAAAVGLGVPLLAACGGNDASGSTPAPAAGEDLGLATEVPVGGGKVFPDQQVVVTQPSQGAFKGFSAICTHQRCIVSSVEGGTINCGCHGSKFSIRDGSVVNGPATSPLPEVGVKVAGGEVRTT